MVNVYKHIQQLEVLNNKERGNHIKAILDHERIPYEIQTFRKFYLRGENIIVDYPFNTNSSFDKKKILITAHFNKYHSSPGANDNASGVSVLLELILRLKKEKVNSPLLRFIFFDLEDGCLPFYLVGSKHYIEKNGIKDIEFVFNVDMVGIGDTVILEGIKHTNQSPYFNKLKKNLNSNFHIEFYEKPYYGIPAVNLPIAVSDHTSFLLAGFENACNITTDFLMDKEYRDDLKKGSILPYLKIRLLHLMGNYSSLPKKMQIWHSHLDTSEFISNQTVQKIFDIMWKIIAK